MRPFLILLRHPFPAMLAVVGLALALLAGYAINQGRELAGAGAGQELEIRARIARPQAAALLASGDQEGLQAFCAAIGSATGTRLTILRPDGSVAADSHEEPARMDNHADRPEVAAALRGRLGLARRFSQTSQTEMFYAALPLGEKGPPLGVLRTALPSAAVEGRFAALRHGILLAALGLFALAALATWLLGRRLGQQLTTLREWAAALAAGAPLPRLPAAAPAPLIDLAVALGRMAEELTRRVERISRQRNELEAVFDSMVEGVLTVDGEERIQSFNPAALSLLGLDPGRARGKSTLEAVRNLELQRFTRATLAGSAIQESEILLPAPQGSERAFYLRGVPLAGAAAGGNAGALVVISDVTNLRRLETVRRDFVANVSHELKTPITSITGFVETLLDGAMEEPENARRFLGIIHQQAKRLHAIVEDLLALSRLELGQEGAEIALAAHPLLPRLTAAIDNCRAAAAARQITLRHECPEGLAARLNPPLFEQALVNLIDNAIKYSPAGSSVLVSAKAADSEVVVAVRDQGVGIAPRDQARIFERFFRVDKARSSSMGGTGLGLAIVKHIVQAHGGRITLSSSPGQGSTFAIHLPAAGEGADQPA